MRAFAAFVPISLTRHDARCRYCSSQKTAVSAGRIPPNRPVDSSIIYGLISAVAYGAAEYLSQPAGKNVATWRTSFYYYALGFILLSGLVFFGPSGLEHGLKAPLPGWLLSVGSGFSLLAAVVLFTQGLIKGSIAVVAPIAASYGAVTTILSCISGERFTYWTALGIGLTIIGASGAAVPPTGTRLAEQSLDIANIRKIGRAHV